MGDSQLQLSDNQRYYAYQPLEPHQIRVVELHPGRAGAPLTCNLVAQNLDGAPYEAVSYVWGSVHAAAIITVITDNKSDEQVLPLGGNLSKSLHGLRYSDKRRRLWIDAISINQASTTERKSQVRMMGWIYSQAQRSLCWLGYLSDHDEEANLTPGIAKKFIHAFIGDTEGHMQATRQLFHHTEADQVNAADKVLLRSWQAIKVLFDLEYFHRVWIIQEVGLARHAQMLWGSEEVCLDWSELAAFAAFLDFNGASVVNHLQLKSWVANHISMVWELNTAGKPVYSFVEVLHWARIHRATDPRDHVYALLGHPNARVDGKLLIEPDYTITTKEVYTEIAISLVERTHSLHLLAFVDHHEEPSVLALPTWVPDWHAENLVAPLRFPTNAASDICSVSPTHTPKGVIMESRGYLVDKLSTFSNMLDPSGLTISNIQHELQKKIPFLIDHIWDMVGAQPGAPSTSAVEFISSLSLVLTGGYWNDKHSTSGDRQEQQQADCAAWILDHDRIRIDKYPSKFIAGLSHAENSQVQTMAVRGSAHQFVQDMTWNSMCRKVFRTVNGYIGLGPRIMRSGDCCVVVPGSKYPLLMREADGGFELIGPTLLDGFMNGEAEELCRAGTLSEQVFKIV